jgi:2-polyprenyl-3-methyl-5-hydroxy-6-metoxy-1,4-benzoquinol methylase
MSATATGSLNVEERARATQGSSADIIYRLVAHELKQRGSLRGTLLDVGCGTGQLWSYCRDDFDRYIGADVVRYDGFPEDGQFHGVDLDTGRVVVDEGNAEVVVAVETIEHMENPRALMRELVRLTKPGGLIVVTTPNQLSLLAKLSLALRNNFPAFSEAPGSYPAHLTALLEIDLVRMARECQLTNINVRYTNSGRIPSTAWHWPRFLKGRSFSDNVLLSACKPSTL